MTVSEDNSKICADRNLPFQKNKDYCDLKKMIAKQRLHLEYLQPNLMNPESKASPLALLAATCSSIGKPDNEKKDCKAITSSYNDKVGSRKQEIKTSLEQNKIENELSDKTLKPLTKTCSINTSNSALMSTLKLGQYSPEHKNLRKEHSEGFQVVSRYCHSHTVSDKYHLAQLPSHRSHDQHRECTHCQQPRIDLFSSFRAPLPSNLCQCPSCIRLQSEQKCIHPHVSSMPYPPPYKYNIPTSFTPSCRDPTCKSCIKMSNKNVRNFLHPALVQQCTHSTFAKAACTPPATQQLTHLSSQDNQGKPKPYVCNWVSSGKHCGLSYINSDDLFQHLKTHTSLQQQHQNEIDNLPVRSTSLSRSESSSVPILSSINAQAACRIHGCPCSLSPKKNTGKPGYSYAHFESSSIRYSPYARPLPHVGGDNYTRHNYLPHGFHH